MVSETGKAFVGGESIEQISGPLARRSLRHSSNEQHGSSSIPLHPTSSSAKTADESGILITPLLFKL